MRWLNKQLFALIAAVVLYIASLKKDKVPEQEAPKPKKVPAPKHPRPLDVLDAALKAEDDDF